MKGYDPRPKYGNDNTAVPKLVGAFIILIAVGIILMITGVIDPRSLNLVGH